MAKRVRKIQVEVRRDGTNGYLYSQVADVNGSSHYMRKDGETYMVVVDRQRGRMLDSETVIHRARALANVLGVPYVEELEWPCISTQGMNGCRCPECVKEPSRKHSNRK